MSNQYNIFEIQNVTKIDLAKVLSSSSLILTSWLVLQHLVSLVLRGKEAKLQI